MMFYMDFLKSHSWGARDYSFMKCIIQCNTSENYKTFNFTMFGPSPQKIKTSWFGGRELRLLSECFSNSVDSCWRMCAPFFFIQVSASMLKQFPNSGLNPGLFNMGPQLSPQQIAMLSQLPQIPQFQLVSRCDPSPPPPGILEPVFVGVGKKI